MIMARMDYDEIRQKTGMFLDMWKGGTVDGLDEIVVSDAVCNLGTVKEYPDGSQHSRYGVENFILDTPRADVFFIRTYNYVCRIKEEMAQQSFVAIGRAVKESGGEDIQSFEFSAFFNNCWVRQDEGWKMKEIRMDIVDYHGDYEEFLDCWYYEDPKAKWYAGIHLPVIQGELDSPWTRIPVAWDVLSEEEKCMEQFLRYAYGIDTLAFAHVNDAMDEGIVINMAPWGTMDKRGFMTAVKYHRQAARYWTHTVKPESIDINGDVCEMKLYRMAGHRQRTHNVEIVRGNMDREYACARYEVRMEKKEGIWKMTRMYYYLGVIECGCLTE